MIGRILCIWDGLVESVTVLAITVLALCVMSRVAKLKDLPRYLGMIVGIAILLIMLPAIIGSLWNSMSLMEHLGIVGLVAAVAIILSASRGLSNRARNG